MFVEQIKDQIHEGDTVDDALQKTIAVLEKLKQENEGLKIVFISGPMKSTDPQTVIENRDRLIAAYQELDGEKSLAIAAPVIFPNGLREFVTPDTARGQTFNHFWIGLLERGPIDKVVMLPGWQDSPGAKAEHAAALTRGLLVEEYTPRRNVAAARVPMKRRLR